MADHNELGKRGEELALRYLEKEGYGILERNWRYDRKEIDIIAYKDEYLVVVEVKTRSTDSFGDPWESVDTRKQKLLIDAIETYVEQRDIDMEIRYDVISVILKNNEHKLEHIPFAFYPEPEE